MKATANGYAALTPGRLGKLLAEREADIAAIHRILAIVTGEQVTKKRARPDILADALALDAQRREKKGRTPKGYEKHRASSRPGTKGAKAQRTATARTLAKIERGAALTTADGKRIPVLSRYGYIKKHGDAHVRTEKPFEV